MFFTFDILDINFHFSDKIWFSFPIIYKKISELAKIAFVLLKGRLFGRIDIKMDHKGIPYFIEANLMPGLQKGYFYRSCSINLKMDYDQMITKISENALNF